jgi:hypothetical protein
MGRARESQRPTMAHGCVSGQRARGNAAVARPLPTTSRSVHRPPRATCSPGLHVQPTQPPFYPLCAHMKETPHHPHAASPMAVQSRASLRLPWPLQMRLLLLPCGPASVPRSAAAPRKVATVSAAFANHDWLTLTLNRLIDASSSPERAPTTSPTLPPMPTAAVQHYRCWFPFAPLHHGPPRGQPAPAAIQCRVQVHEPRSDSLVLSDLTISTTHLPFGLSTLNPCHLISPP